MKLSRAVVVASADHFDRLPYRLPGVPRARQGHRLDLREWISCPASLAGSRRMRSLLATGWRRSASRPAGWCGKPEA